jgi:PST family polysaccharide transporter
VSSEKIITRPDGPRENTYGQILKSSALVGGASVLNLAVAIVRSKIMALLLGPSGVGLIGLYQAIADFGRTIAGMGISNSGVRQIAEAAGTGDELVIARTATALRRVAVLLGLVGALGLLILAPVLSRMSFRETGHAPAVAVLSLAVLFATISAGQTALLQGMRQIRHLALSGILGGIGSLLLSIPCVCFFRERATNWVVVIAAATGLIFSWWFSRRVRIQRVSLGLAGIAAEISALLKLGLVFMTSALVTTGVAYTVRALIFRKFGEAAAGFYQAAWAIGGYYVGFILQAMGSDFYPRLTAVARNNEECNRLVNEQSEIGLLLAGPGILATLTFAPWVIQLFYSGRFGPAVEILRWISLGMLLRVIGWPMGFIVVAKGAKTLFLASELVNGVVQIAFVWLGLTLFGLRGTGIAFFASYVFYWFFVYAIVAWLSGFRWSGANLKIGLVYIVVIGSIFLGWYWLPRWIVQPVGALLTIGAGIFSMRQICTLVPADKMPPLVRRIAQAFGAPLTR